MEKQASDLDPNPGFIIDQDLQVDPQKNSLVSLCKREYQGTAIEPNICNISAIFNITSTV